MVLTCALLQPLLTAMTGPSGSDLLHNQLLWARRGPGELKMSRILCSGSSWTCMGNSHGINMTMCDKTSMEIII